MNNKKSFVQMLAYQTGELAPFSTSLRHSKLQDRSSTQQLAIFTTIPSAPKSAPASVDAVKLADAAADRAVTAATQPVDDRRVAISDVASGIIVPKDSTSTVRRKKTVFDSSPADELLRQKLRKMGAPIQIPDSVYIGFRAWQANDNDPSTSGALATESHDGTLSTAEPDDNGFDRSVPPILLPITPTGLLGRVARQRMRSLTPEFEHCNIWIVWTIEGQKLFVLLNNSRRFPSALRFRRNGSKKDAETLLLALPDGPDNPDMALDALRWCADNANKPFNNSAFFFNHIPGMPDMLKIKAEGSSFYCAEEVSSLLKYLHVKGFEDYHAYDSTPDEIYKILTETTGVIPTVMHTGRIKFESTSARHASDRARSRRTDTHPAETEDPAPVAGGLDGVHYMYREGEEPRGSLSGTSRTHREPEEDMLSGLGGGMSLAHEASRLFKMDDSFYHSW